MSTYCCLDESRVAIFSLHIFTVAGKGGLRRAFVTDIRCLVGGDSAGETSLLRIRGGGQEVRGLQNLETGIAKIGDVSANSSLLVKVLLYIRIV